MEPLINPALPKPKPQSNRASMPGAEVNDMIPAGPDRTYSYLVRHSGASPARLPKGSIIDLDVVMNLCHFPENVRIWFYIVYESVLMILLI